MFIAYFTMIWLLCGMGQKMYLYFLLLQAVYHIVYNGIFSGIDDMMWAYI